MKLRQVSDTRTINNSNIATFPTFAVSNILDMHTGVPTRLPTLLLLALACSPKASREFHVRSFFKSAKTPILYYTREDPRRDVSFEAAHISLSIGQLCLRPDQCSLYHAQRPQMMITST